MKRFLMMDRSNTDRLTTEQNTRTEAGKAFYNKYGYNPDVIKIIDDMGGVVKVLK